MVKWGTTLADWSPSLYTRFEAERTQPAIDLARRLPDFAAPVVVDLGCGPGNSTQVLRARYPDARLSGIDSSPAMLEAARLRLPDVPFALGDAAVWAPRAPADVIYANALFQWIPGRLAVFKRLMGHLKPGGVLAVQMPDNFDEPVRRLMREVAAEPRFAAALAGAAAAREAIDGFDATYDALIGTAARVDLWRTAYVHALQGAEAIVEWVRATGLRPFLEPLGEADRAAFLARYTALVAGAFPARADGLCLLPFPRIFIVAKRR